MILLNVPNKTAFNILYCYNDVIDNTNNIKFKEELIDDKFSIKRSMGKALGIPKDFLTDYHREETVRQ